MQNGSMPMTKAQKHVVMDKRLKEYGRQTLQEFIENKYGIANVDLSKLTKEQAQAIICNFKAHKKEENKNGN